MKRASHTTSDPGAFYLGNLAADPGDSDHGGEGLVEIQEYLRGILRRWKLVLLITVLGVVASLVHFSITPARYQATTMLQIERNQPASLISNQAPWLENLWNMEYYPTQYRLLESRGMAERVVQDLRLDENPKFAPAVDVDHTGATAEADRTALAGIASRIQGGLAVEPIRGTQLVQLTYRSSDAELAARLANGFADAFIEWGIETRSGRVGKASTSLDEEITTLKDEVADREQQLQVLARNQEVLNFTPDASVTSQRLQSLNDQYMTAKRQRIELEARSRELDSSRDRTVVDSQGEGVVANLVREQIQMEREYATQLRTYKPDWPGMKELKARIDKGQQYLDSVISEEADRVRLAARTAMQAARRQEQALEREIEQLKGQMVDNSSVAVQYNNLQVEVASRRELLDELLRRQSEAEVALRIQDNRETNVRIVDRALVPGRPYHPNFRRSAGMGLAAGLLLGLAGALLLEFMDRSIKNGDEVERLLGLPVLAVIPEMGKEGRQGGYGYGYGYGYGRRSSRGSRSGKGASGSAVAGQAGRRWLEKRSGDAPTIELIPHHRPRLAVSEAYRALRTSLLLSSAEDLHVVAVTSSGASEGKTVTASNLAVVMAQLGRRVLLIDADLRKPRLHKVFNLSNRSGLVHFLTGGAELGDLVQRTAVSNLWLVPAGPMPPNPSELLASHHMEDLLSQARADYDMVIFDTPPVLAVTDATLVGDKTDGVILCLRSGQVLREDARSCRNRLERGGIKILGAVLNGFRPQTGRYSKDYRYYEAYAAHVEDSQESGVQERMG